MDIAINQPIEFTALKAFLIAQFPTLDFSLLYCELNDWASVTTQQAVFQYIEDNELEDGFKYGLSLYTQNDENMIERLAFELAQYFKCSTLCDASRVVLKESNSHYSLLFENGRVYLVDDYGVEETGKVTKLVALAYQCPEYNFT